MLVYAFLYAPILVLVLYSFNDSVQTAAWRGFTTRWYAAALRSNDLTESALTSVAVAGCTTAAAVVASRLRIQRSSMGNSSSRRACGV